MLNPISWVESVKHLYRRFGDMGRAHVQALRYHALPQLICMLLDRVYYLLTC
ncbi:hypothetical protein HanXRQr2_Chr10g0422581 [Helianthus annuus]|uniref:Uncharacterized protein n=1 Tax=Helianthus annuus TaxID=4232 RepID=A0A9K3N2T6_HELAN|nr:hypothetical protein HanXRQr2_Chr10g0422581 [Helianthus annuus]